MLWFSNSSLDEQFIFIHSSFEIQRNEPAARHICASFMCAVLLSDWACLFLCAYECVFSLLSVAACLFRKVEIIGSHGYYPQNLNTKTAERESERIEETSTKKDKTDKTHFTKGKNTVATNRNRTTRRTCRERKKRHKTQLSANGPISTHAPYATEQRLFCWHLDLFRVEWMLSTMIVFFLLCVCRSCFDCQGLGKMTRERTKKYWNNKVHVLVVKSHTHCARTLHTQTIPAS